MIVSYRKRSSPELESGTQSFESRKDRAARPKSNMFASFWQNLFRSSNSNPETSQATKLEPGNNNIEILTDSAAMSSSSSSESVNTILSTHSFSYVSAKKYRGKRGKRIPITGHQNERLVSKPPPGVTNNNGRASNSKASSSTPGIRPQRKFGTLTRLGMKIGLKSKYNLQSCESLPRFGMESAGNTMTNTNTTLTLKKRRAPAPPLPTTPVPAQEPELHSRSIDGSPVASTSASNQSQRHRRAFSESTVTENKARMHVRRKRRAPVPPNPFGDPDAPEPEPSAGTSASFLQVLRANNPELVVDSQKSEPEPTFVFNPSKPGPSKEAKVKIEKPTQSAQDELRVLEATMSSLQAHEKRINDEVKAQLILLKEAADQAPLPAQTETETNSTGTFLYAKPEKPSSSALAFSATEDTPKKIVPKPWYKRSPSKSASKKIPPKPLILLAKISELDREAVRIIAENRRRSAENAYNESAKELITMFSNKFTPSPDPSSNLAEAASEIAAVGTTTEATSVQRPEIAQSSASVNASSSTEDHKKLAIVQPQTKPQGSSLSGLGAYAGRSSAATPYTRNPSQYFFRASAANSESEEWPCPRCTLRNPHWRALCEACYFRKDSIGSYSPQMVSEHVLSSSNSGFKPESGFKPSSNGNTYTKPVQQVKPEEQSALPPCENFLSQFPDKNNLALEQKLVGMKLFDDPEIEELDIQKLRHARVAFFTKIRQEEEQNFKPNNLNPSVESWNAANPESEIANVFEDEYETIDAVARLHQQLNPNTSGSGPGTWKPLHVHRFQPMLDSILESTNSENFYEHPPRDFQSRPNPVYENWKFKLSDLEEENVPWTRSFMQNVQMEIKDQIRFFDSLNPQYDSEDFQSDSELAGNHTNMDKQEFTVEDYRRLGAIPKHLRRNGTPSQAQNGGRSRDEQNRKETRQRKHVSEEQNETFAISKVLRKLEWAISRGDHKLAASLAHDLALRKVNCVVAKNDKPITIRVYVEDRLMQQGPFLVQVTPSMKVKGLKTKIECDWGIPTTFQKWILGRKMAEDDEQLLSHFEIVHDSMGFLYLVTPDFEAGPTTNPNQTNLQQQSNTQGLNEKSAQNGLVQHKKQPKALQRNGEDSNESFAQCKMQEPKQPESLALKAPKEPIPIAPSNVNSKNQVAQNKEIPSKDLQPSLDSPKLPLKKSVQPEFKESKANIHSPPSFSPEPQSLNQVPMAKSRQAKKVVQKVNRGTGTVLDVPVRIAQASVPESSTDRLGNNSPKPNAASNSNVESDRRTAQVLTPVPAPRSSLTAHIATDSASVPKLISYNSGIENASPIPFPRSNVHEASATSSEIKKSLESKPCSPSSSQSEKSNTGVQRSEITIEERILPISETSTRQISPKTVPKIEKENQIVIRTASINVIEEVPKIPPKAPNTNSLAEKNGITKIAQSYITPKAQAQPVTPAAVLLCEPRRKSFGDYVNPMNPLMNRGVVRHELNPGNLSKTIQKYEALQNPAKGEFRKDLSGFGKFRSHQSNSNGMPTEANSRTAGIRSFLTRKNSDGPDINLEVTEAMTNQHAGSSKDVVPENKEGNVQTYMNMLHLMEKEDLVPTFEDVDCPVCLSRQPGVTLRDCLHSFCRDCLVGAIQYSEEPQVKCPFRDDDYSCDSFIQEREIKALVPKEMFEKLLAQSMKMAESRMKNAYHCKTNDCTGWCIFEDDVNVFNCPVCSKRNCLTCQAIHTGKDCLQYQRELAIAAETDEDAKSSRLMLEKMIQRGEALECPACHVVLLKKWGCDFVKCTYCKTEICWITKGFRWGPNGKGDTSGGCKCGVNGVRCHPKCTYCH